MNTRFLFLIISLCFCGVSCEQQEETEPNVEEPERTVEETARKELKLNQDQELIVAAFNLETDRVKELLKAGANPSAKLGF